MGWQGSLQLDYRRDRYGKASSPRTVVHDRHHGPLRILASLYPEGPQVCHNVLVHPPGGIVGGDVLTIHAHLAADSHALITTPGATRFYRSTGDTATQTLTARLGAGARLEWLPLETIAYSGSLAENKMRFELAPGAEMMGWDVLALGLPASGEAFERGRFTQSIELPGRWLERGVIAADDRLLLDSPLGLAGHRAVGTLWFAAGEALPSARSHALLDAARACCEAHALANLAGATAPHAAVTVLRVLAPRVEPLLDLLVQVRSAWRALAWSLPANPPRVWRT